MNPFSSYGEASMLSSIAKWIQKFLNADHTSLIWLLFIKMNDSILNKNISKKKI